MKNYKVKYKGVQKIIKAKDSLEAVEKFLNNEEANIEDERLSPMTYKKLKELGYDKNDWQKWNQEQANEIVAKGRQESQNKEEKTNTETSGKTTNKEKNEQENMINAKEQISKIAISKPYKDPDTGRVVHELEPSDESLNKARRTLEKNGYKEVDRYIPKNYDEDMYVVYTSEKNGERDVAIILANGPNNWASVQFGYNEDEDADLFDDDEQNTKKSEVVENKKESKSNTEKNSVALELKPTVDNLKELGRIKHELSRKNSKLYAEEKAAKISGLKELGYTDSKIRKALSNFNFKMPSEFYRTEGGKRLKVVEEQFKELREERNKEKLFEKKIREDIKEINKKHGVTLATDYAWDYKDIPTILKNIKEFLEWQ